MADVRAVGYCHSGCRAWAEAVGLDWPTFLAHGLPVEEFDRLNDGLGNAVARSARERAR